MSANNFFIIYVIIFYIVTPIYITFVNNDKFYMQLAIISVIFCMFIKIGVLIEGFLPKILYRRIQVNKSKFIFYSFITFSIFAIYSFYTAGGIPLVQIFYGLDGDLLRGELFKGRNGVERILLYLSAFFTYVILPLSLLYAFQLRQRYRFLLLALSVIFSIATLQKALVLNMLFPLITLLIIEKKLKIRYVIMVGMILFLYFIIMIELTIGSERVRPTYDLMSFFSPSYKYGGAIDYFVWRLVAVPIYTARDTLLVFEEHLLGIYLSGGTSSFLSFLFGVDNVNIEKLVFAYQFGGFNVLANANSFSGVALFVDFGYLGLVVFGLFGGIIFQLLQNNQDTAIRAMGYLMAYKLMNAPLVGLILGNGFLLVFLIGWFLKDKKR